MSGKVQDKQIGFRFYSKILIATIIGIKNTYNLGLYNNDDNKNNNDDEWLNE